MVAIGYFLVPTAAIPALGAGTRPSLTELEGELICPTCHTTLAPTHKGFDLLAWWLPFVGVSIGGTYVTFTIWRWRNEPVIDEDDEGEDAFSLEETLVSTHGEL